MGQQSSSFTNDPASTTQLQGRRELVSSEALVPKHPLGAPHFLHLAHSLRRLVRLKSTGRRKIVDALNTPIVTSRRNPSGHERTDKTLLPAEQRGVREVLPSRVRASAQGQDQELQKVATGRTFRDAHHRQGVSVLMGLVSLSPRVVHSLQAAVQSSVPPDLRLELRLHAG